MKAAPLLVAIAAAGCGGKPANKPVEPEQKISARPVTRVPIEDTEPEDGVQFQTAHGHMEVSVIDAGLAPHSGELTDCYMTRVNRRRWLGGHVVLHWDVTKNGDVTAVKLAESDLGNWAIEKCLLEVARSASFGKPVGGDADFTVPLDFSAKGRPLTWEEDQSVKAVGGQLAKLDTCAKGKIGKPEDVTITLYVGAHGHAQSVGFSSARSVLEDAWAECAEKAALAWRLPDPRGQVAKLAVRYRAR